MGYINITMKQNELLLRTDGCNNILNLCNKKYTDNDCKNWSICCNYYTQQKQRMLSINQAREIRGRPPYEGVEEYFIFWN